MFQPSQRIREYEIEGPIGEGAMGQVWRARHVFLNQVVALKVLDPASGANPDRVRRFVAEGMEMAAFQHPRILNAKDFFQEGSLYVLVLPFMGGGTLADRIQEHPNGMPLEEVQRILMPMLRALDHAHRNGVVHRDVKPANILFDDQGEPFLSDFGIAKRLGVDQGTRTKMAIGTPAYMAPEQILAPQGIDGRADQYALGCVAYEMLTGQLLFGEHITSDFALQRAHVQEPPAPPRSLRKDLPEAWEAVILRALTKAQEERWPSCGAMADALDDVGQGVVQPQAYPPTQSAHQNPNASPRATVTQPTIVDDQIQAVAKAQRRLLLCVIAIITGNIIPSIVEIISSWGGVVGCAMLPVMLGIVGFSIWSVYKLCKALERNPVIWALAMFIPFVNIICLIALNSSATAYLKSRGIKVGLLGAKPLPPNPPLQVLVEPSKAPATPAGAAAPPKPGTGSHKPLWKGLLGMGLGAALLLGGGLGLWKMTAGPTIAPGPIIDPIKKPTPEPSTPPNELGMEMVKIPAGSFLMGSPPNEEGHQDGEVQHQVTISQPFWMGKYPVTQKQWQDLMGNNPSAFMKAGPNAPVERVSWNETQEFLQKLNERQRQWTYRLPTEAEWEYACRAGSTGPRYGDLDAIAWYGGNSGKTTHPVGQKQSNAFGLYDMLGNVWEWCQDWDGNYSAGPQTDPTGASRGESRVVRGSPWQGDHAANVRSAYRVGVPPEWGNYILGFRVVAVARPQ